MKRLVLGITVLFCFNLVILTGAQATTNLRVPATNQEEMPPSAVERAITLPRGWGEIDLGFRKISSNEMFDSDGDLTDLRSEKNFFWDKVQRKNVWRYPREGEEGYNIFKGFELVDYILDLRLRWGLSRNVTLGLEIPFIVNRSYEDKDTGRSFDGSEFGDGSFWATWQLLHRDTENWMTSLGLRFKTFVPSGNDSPGQIPLRRQKAEQVEWQQAQDPPSTASLPLVFPFLTPQISSRGVMGFSLAALAKQQIYFLSYQVEAGYIIWWREDATDVLGTGISSILAEYGDWGEVFLNWEGLFNLNDFLELVGVPEDHVSDIVSFLFFPISLPIKWIWPGNAMASKVVLGSEFEFTYFDGIEIGVRGDVEDIEALAWWTADIETEVWALNYMPKILWQINDHWDIGFKYYFALGGKNTRALFPLTTVPGDGSFKANITYRF
ncbi:hypothetical protein ACFL4G_03315 [Thermodesulfobacteriota bacterium]